MTRPLLQRLALLARRRYRGIFLVALSAAVVAALLIGGLRFDTDFMNLLPRDEPLVRTFRESLEEFGSIDYLLVAVRIPEGAVVEPYEEFVDRLGERLQGLDGLREVEYRLGDIDELMAEFLPKAILFLDASSRERLVEALSDSAIRERAQELKRIISTPQILAIKDLVKLDPLGLTPIFLDLVGGSSAGLSLDWSSTHFLSRDHRMLLLLAKPVEPPQNVEAARDLLATLGLQVKATQDEWAELAGSGAGPPPEVVLGGRHVIALGDEALIRNDVIVNIATSLGGVLLLFLLAFRRFSLLIYALIPLSCGLLLTFGFSALTLGELNLATSGVAALLIGLGIDFVIVSYGRFVEERRRGRDLEESLALMSGSSGRAVVVGGITSAATFYAFGVTEFTALSEMGFLTGTGILFCMLAVLFLLPAMLAWSEDRERGRRRIPRFYLHGLGSHRLIDLSFRHPLPVVAVSLALLVGAGFLALGVEFDDSVQNMRPAGNQGVNVREEVAQRYGAGFDHMMLIMEGESLEAVLELAGRAAEGGRRLVDQGVLNGMDSVTSILPPPARQERALEWLREARRERLDMERIRSVFARELADEGLRIQPFAGGLDLLGQAVARTDPIEPSDFYESAATRRLLNRYLHRTESGWKAVVYLYPPPRLWRRQPPPQVEELAEQLGPLARLTGANVVSRFLRRQVVRDAQVASLIGLVAVALLLWLDYRRLSDTMLSLAPLVIGIVWMLGGMAILDLSMNFMNIFVSTMIIGIGVDYGVHMIHRFRELGSASEERLRLGLIETGKAIVLAALSTTVGFGSLSLSHYPGLRSMGLVAIMGALFTCLVAISLLPAILSLIRRRRATLSGAGE